MVEKNRLWSALILGFVLGVLLVLAEYSIRGWAMFTGYFLFLWYWAKNELKKIEKAGTRDDSKEEKE